METFSLVTSNQCSTSSRALILTDTVGFCFWALSGHSSLYRAKRSGEGELSRLSQCLHNPYYFLASYHSFQHTTQEYQGFQISPLGISIIGGQTQYLKEREEKCVVLNGSVYVKAVNQDGCSRLT